MKIYILGVGDAFSQKHYSTSFVLESDGFFLGVECPHPYLKMLKENSELKISDMDNMVITHLHADHCSGLETVAFYKKFVENKKLNVCMNWNDYYAHVGMVSPGMGRAMVDDTLVNVDIWDYIEYNILNDVDAIPVGPFRISRKNTLHYIPSSALLISDGKYSVGFSGDTGYDPKIIRWLDNADLILHETGPAPGHTPLEDLNKLENRIKDKMMLIHYSDIVETDFKKAKEGQVIQM
jgi:ribonuclease BN (tRNA processing enzyme)